MDRGSKAPRSPETGQALLHSLQEHQVRLLGGRRHGRRRGREAPAQPQTQGTVLTKPAPVGNANPRFHTPTPQAERAQALASVQASLRAHLQARHLATLMLNPDPANADGAHNKHLDEIMRLTATTVD